MSEATRLWKVWWLGGIAFALAAAGMFAAAESARDGGHPYWGDLLDIARLALYWLWFRMVWKSARNVELRLWTPMARATALAGLLAMALS